ncbi:hypothetical protein [Enterococcus sp. C76]|uniref:hypothetical protein n=1 Tax=Enterococcus sp. C76 TaxID=3231334 RepID=UPI0034A0094F
MNRYISWILKYFVLIAFFSSITALVTTLVFEKSDAFPKKYVIQSQVVINPKIDNEEDEVKKMDLLKYNENYNLMVYSPSFLKKVIDKLDSDKYQKIGQVKANLKVIYSTTSQVITLQQTFSDKIIGMKLANVMQEEFCVEGTKLFPRCELVVLSSPFVTQTIRLSTTVIFVCFNALYFMTCILIVIYIKRNTKKGKHAIRRSK